ncbi:MAG: nitroreductase family protein [Christensenellaceae bacterium]|jgi:nitroreductase|nr:nitroreductase family protein [Christensenellaceae bacterium]
MILDAIKNRKSIRNFDPNGKITKEEITEMLTAGMLAPSACALYPVEYVVVGDRKKLNEIMKIHPYTGMLKNATHAIIVVANVTKTNAIARGMYVQDCSASAENILLQAASMGIGTCWCAINPNPKLISAFHAALNLPDNMEPFCCIAVGIPAEPFGSRGKFDAAKIKWQ